MTAPDENISYNEHNYKEIERIVNNYRNNVIAHAIFKKIAEKIRDFLLTSPGKRMVLLYGPPGCGKTTMGEVLVAQLTDKIMSSEKHDPGRIIAAMSRVPSVHSGPYDWSEVYIQALEVLDEPLIEYKTYKRGLRRNLEGQLIIESASKNVLRRALIQCLQYRKLKMYYWDEAHEFAKVGNPNHLINQMENIKYILEESKTNFVLAGVYQLLELRDLSGQLGRRAIKIHFPRYCLKKEDVDAFGDYLYTLQETLPLSEKPDFMSDIRFYFERCLGCAGTLKDLVSDSLSTALLTGMKTLTKSLIDAHVDWPTLLKIKEEIEEGEQLVSALAQEDAKRKVQLFLGSIDSPKNDISDRGSDNLEEEGNSRRNSQHRRVGERAPHRDPLGDNNNC